MLQQPIQLLMPSMSNAPFENCDFNDRIEWNDKAVRSMLMHTQTIAAPVTTPSYRDFSRILATPSDYDITADCKFAEKFPSKLYKILADPSLKHILTWLPHGRGWKIVDLQAFETKVLPRYFGHRKYSNFRRQLSVWGFSKITHRSYYHEMFLRGMPHLCLHMKRFNDKQISKNAKKDTHSVNRDFVKQCQNNPMPEDISSDLQPWSELPVEMLLQSVFA